MVRLLFVWCAVFLFGNAEAVSLRVETAAGDSVFFASQGDTVSVSVRIDSQGQVLTGVELFLKYDPRAFAQIDTVQKAFLFGRVLIDSQRVLSDSVAVIHFAEADLVGKVAVGDLFEIRFLVLDLPVASSFALLTGDARYASAYTTVSDVGETFAFEQISILAYKDFAPQLHVPARLTVLEDEMLVSDLKTWATDAESGHALTWHVVAQTEHVEVVITDTLTLVITPEVNFHGEVSMSVVVTDGASGQAQGDVILDVLPVNDPPQLVAGVLPDSVMLVNRNVMVSLLGAALDVDGDPVVWTGQGTEDVGVEVTDDQVAHIFAALDWVGDVTVFVFATDSNGAGIAFPIRVIRDLAVNVLPGDFDGNGEVGFPDFLSFAQAFGQTSPSAEADLNGDGRVDFSDFLVFAQNFGRKF